MRRCLSLGIPLLAASAAVAAILLLAIQPWGDDEASGNPIEYRLCDVVIQAPPDAFNIYPLPDGENLWLMVRSKERTAAVNPQPGAPALQHSQVSVDAKTGAFKEHYATPDDEAALKPLVSQRKIYPLDTTTAPWPYTDSVQLRPQRARQGAEGMIEWRQPDPGAGLAVDYIISEGIDSSIESLALSNCRSTMRMDVRARTAEVTFPVKDIDPADEAAFETFFSEAKVGEPRP
jgi:hypothetical protein